MLPTGRVSEFTLELVGTRGTSEGSDRSQIGFWEANMRTATITLCGADFAGEMIEMRTWLDQHFFEPARFTYKQDGEIVVISVDFQEEHHAEAFQSRFTGREPEADFSLSSADAPLSRAADDRLGGSETPATMAQACWWRLLAEEIRTEADAFNSESAKETMEMAAKGWEQLAEELEQRLARNDQQQGLSR
jgi:hypothetical protein